MHSGNAGNLVQQKKVFGFEIFINNDILAELESVQKWFDSTRKITGTEKIEFNGDLTIPDLNGRNIQVPTILLRYMTKRCRRSFRAVSFFWQTSIKNLKK